MLCFVRPLPCCALTALVPLRYRVRSCGQLPESRLFHADVPFGSTCSVDLSGSERTAVCARVCACVCACACACVRACVRVCPRMANAVRLSVVPVAPRALRADHEPSVLRVLRRRDPVPPRALVSGKPRRTPPYAFRCTQQRRRTR